MNKEIIFLSPPVSVIVVTKGQHAHAEQAVRSILATDFPAALRQIVVLEETSTPQPITGDGVEYHTLEVLNLGVAYARNQGLKLARHPLVLFTDDDCLVDTKWLKEMVQPFGQRPQLGALAGAVLVPPCGLVGQCENILGFPGGGVKYLQQSKGQLMPIATFSTCNCAIQRSVTGDIHFPEGFLSAGEDELLSREIGRNHPMLYNPKAVVRHQPRDSFSGVFSWFVRRGQARVLKARHVEHRLRYNLRMAVISPSLRLAVLLIMIALLKAPVLPVLLGVFFLYCASVWIRFRWAWSYYPSLRTQALLPLVKATMDLGMDVGVVKTWLKGRP